VTVNIANSGTVTFNRSDSLTYAGAMTGTGLLTKSGTGTLSITSASQYTGTFPNAGSNWTGDISINAGTLDFGGGGPNGYTPGYDSNQFNGGTPIPNYPLITIASGATLALHH